MQPERWQSCIKIFSAAVERPRDERPALLERSCGGDEVLRRKVEMLLKYHDKSGDFIDSPAFVVAPELLIDDPDALIGQHLGCYRIDAVLGVGGMGVVYLACDERLERKVGLKLLPQSLLADEARWERLKREARTASALNHPNIMTIHEFGEVDSTHYIATEFIEGTTLRERMTTGPILPNEAVDIAIQVASALCVAHGAGIVHCDVKPENIMLRPDGYVKVLDFGIAKVKQQETLAATTSAGVTVPTQQGKILGTTRYMSPEQARGQTVDARSDLWSLGVVLYEMLAEHPPFEGEKPTDVMTAVLLKHPQPLEQRATIVPPALQRVVEKSLRKDPAERYQTAEEMLSELRAIEEKADGTAPAAAANNIRGSNRPAQSARWIGFAAVAALLVSFAVFYGWRDGHAGRAVTPAPIEKSIAILPFENLSDDKQNAYFADGVHEEILTTLAKVGDLKVISRTSVMQFRDGEKRNLRDIAQQLGVAYVLEGTVQRTTNRIRVTAQLIDTRTDSHVWADRFDGELADVFGIQTEIAQEIASQLKAALSPKEQAALRARSTVDTAAYDLYLQAREIDRGGNHGAPDAIQKEVTLLDQAVARDPAFVPALCMLAQAHLRAYFYNHDHTPARLERARKALDAAARLQPDAGEVHLARAVFHYWGSRDYAPALAELSLASRSLPNDADVLFFIALIERRQGRWKESIEAMERVFVLDPRNAILAEERANNFSSLRRYHEARRVLDAVLNWKPDDFWFQILRAEIDLAENADLVGLQMILSADVLASAEQNLVASTRRRVALLQRNYRAAEEALAEYRLPDFAENGFITPREYFGGCIARGLGDAHRAEAAFSRARERAAAAVAARPDDAKALIVLAAIDARLGSKEEAVREAERAAEMLPEASDALDGSRVLARLATVYAEVRETNRALEILQQIVALPLGPSYGDLKLDEVWDPLRGHPRFEEIVASRAPKQLK